MRSSWIIWVSPKLMTKSGRTGLWSLWRKCGHDDRWILDFLASRIAWQWISVVWSHQVYGNLLYSHRKLIHSMSFKLFELMNRNHSKKPPELNCFTNEFFQIFQERINTSIIKIFANTRKRRWIFPNSFYKSNITLRGYVIVT